MRIDYNLINNELIKLELNLKYPEIYDKFLQELLTNKNEIRMLDILGDNPEIRKVCNDTIVKDNLGFKTNYYETFHYDYYYCSQGCDYKWTRTFKWQSIPKCPICESELKFHYSENFTKFVTGYLKH